MRNSTEQNTELRLCFPPYIKRVTGGKGGDSYLIFGEEKTALYDCGMACCSDMLIENIERELELEAEAQNRRRSRSLDYVLISHTHYDHIGALPYILKRWPEAKVLAALKAKQVFSSETALNTMRRLGEVAKNKYGITAVDINTDGMRVDLVAEEGMRIDLGGREVEVYETKGHTDCALSFMLLPEKVMLASESTGVPSAGDLIYSVPLKSFEQTLESARKLKESEPELLILPHYGRLHTRTPEAYFDAYAKYAREEVSLIEEAAKAGLDDEAILERHKKSYWTEARKAEQPYEAYEMNTRIIIANIRHTITGM